MHHQNFKYVIVSALIGIIDSLHSYTYKNPAETGYFGRAKDKYGGLETNANRLGVSDPGAWYRHP